MNWSSNWSDKPDEPKSEAQKVHDDAAMYGIGFIKDGKHVPREDVFMGSEPIAPEFAKPQVDKITEEAKEASEWVKKIGEIEWIDEGEAANEAMKALGVAEIRPIKLGNKTIPVIVVGDLGLDFCEPGEKDSGWNIYHLPTLAGFSSVVPPIHPSVKEDDVDYMYDKPELLRWMARVQENYPTSWQVLRLLTPDTYLDNGETAKEIIQKWCLSVKVE